MIHTYPVRPLSGHIRPSINSHGIDVDDALNEAQNTFGTPTVTLWTRQVDMLFENFVTLEVPEAKQGNPCT